MQAQTKSLQHNLILTEIEGQLDTVKAGRLLCEHEALHQHSAPGLESYRATS